jgi:SM-20-related protein
MWTNDRLLTPDWELHIDALVTQGYTVVDGFLQPEEVFNLVELFRLRQKEGLFRQAAVGSGADRSAQNDIRRDHISWVERDDLASVCPSFLNKLDECVQHFNRSLFLGIRDFEMHFAIYPVGAFYKRHLDVFRKDSDRVLSLICYLNTDWAPNDGGELRLYLSTEDGGETAVDLAPLGGRMVLLQSDRIEHEVLPARRERTSLTGWMKNGEVILP